VDSESHAKSETRAVKVFDSTDWHSALSALAERHGARLAQLEERLTAAERAAGDLDGQLRNLR